MPKSVPCYRSKRKRRYLFPATLTKSFRFQVISNHDVEELYLQKKTRIYLERRLLKDSEFFEKNECREVPRFHRDELKFGNQLGAGQFGRVYEILSFQRSECGDDSSSDNTEDGDASSSSSWPSTSLIKAPGKASRKNHILGISETAAKEDDTMTTTLNCLHSSLVVPHYGYFIDPGVSSLRDSHEANESDEGRSKLQNQRAYLIDHVHNGDTPRYALKMVREDLRDDKEHIAIIDLACEAKFLSAMRHRNIIQIRANMGSVGKPNHFGIVMDRLSGTLQESVVKWREIVHPGSQVPQKSRRSSFRKVSGRIFHSLTSCSIAARKMRSESPPLDCLFSERIAALSDVARGMKYLHSQKIVFRDLKPQNVGMTLEGTYVLFDFGLAKELKVVDLVEKPYGYNATGLTGSRIFMAPEVATCQLYGFSADVFSFSMLMWEVLALDDAYPHMSVNKHFERVILGGLRPRSLKHEIPQSLNVILKRSWATDPGERPTFETILDTMESFLGVGGDTRKGANDDDQSTLFSDESRR